MSVRMRHTHAHTANRRSHHALKEINLGICPKCKAAVLRHTACMNCGTYRGRQVIDVASQMKKKEEKRKRHEAELKGLNVMKSEKKKPVIGGKEEIIKPAKEVKASRGFNMFRRTPAARSGEN